MAEMYYGLKTGEGLYARLRKKAIWDEAGIRDHTGVTNTPAGLEEVWKNVGKKKYKGSPIVGVFAIAANSSACIVKGPSITKEEVQLWLKMQSPGQHPQSAPKTSAGNSPDYATTGLLNEFYCVLLEGPAGTGKTHTLNNITGYAATRTVVCHPALGYEDLLIGLRPELSGNFVVHEGHIVEMTKLALADPTKKFLLVLDEVNRCNTAAVLGDLLMVIERTKRPCPQALQKFLCNDADKKYPGQDVCLCDPPEAEQNISGEQSGSDEEFHSDDCNGKADCKPCERLISKLAAALPLPWSLCKESKKSTRLLMLPKNLHILATMNTTDRSIAPLDLALRRRFAVERIEPDEDAAATQAANSGMNRSFESWRALNTHLAEISPDAVVGHSYFFEYANEDDLWRYGILPQVAEILVNFNEVEAFKDKLKLAVDASPSSWTISVKGRGLGRYPIVVKRPSASNSTATGTATVALESTDSGATTTSAAVVETASTT